jgi:hypothetical protein
MKNENRKSFSFWKYFLIDFFKKIKSSGLMSSLRKIKSIFRQSYLTANCQCLAADIKKDLESNPCYKISKDFPMTVKIESEFLPNRFGSLREKIGSERFERLERWRETPGGSLSELKEILGINNKRA